MSRNTVAYGAALEYTLKALGGPVVETDKTYAVNITPIIIAAGNGDRVGLVVVNLGSANAFVAPDQGVSANLGIQLAPSGGNFSLSVIYDFTLVAREWVAVVPSGGPCNIYVIEYSRFALNP